jgi:MFS family permease
MVLALTLGILVILNLINVVIICVFAFLMGTVNALDAPARQSFVSTLVNKQQLASAIALNSGIFNAARAIGPGIAGLLIASVGSGVAFILNGVSYLAVITALVFIHIEERPSQKIVKPFHAIRDGIRYSFSHPVIRVLMIFTAVLSVFAWPYSTMMPVIARTVYHLDAQGLGYLYSATGLGALVATYLVGKYGNKLSPIVFISAGNIVFTVSQMLFGINDSSIFALLLLLLTGLGLLSQTAMINTLIQGLVRNDFRGRVMSIYILMFVGLAPLGNFFIGYMTETFGISLAIVSNATIVLTFGLIVYTYKKKIRIAYKRYKKENKVDTILGDTP